MADTLTQTPGETSRRSDLEDDFTPPTVRGIRGHVERRAPHLASWTAKRQGGGPTKSRSLASGVGVRTSCRISGFGFEGLLLLLQQPADGLGRVAGHEFLDLG